MVALRKESVDRNLAHLTVGPGFQGVALRKESVDRNLMRLNPTTMNTAVALRKESVDRNPPMCFIKRMPLSRSPQGERG